MCTPNPKTLELMPCAQLFSARQKGQLDVYGLWGCLRGQLLTDDSFVFNRVLGRLKDSISRLPDATPDDEEALTRLKVGARSPLIIWGVLRGLAE